MKIINKSNKKSRGSITIYLSIILVSVMILISIVSESARVDSVQTQSKDYTYMAAESVLAGYGKQIYEDYGVLLVWENEPLKNQLEGYIQDNIKMADLKEKGTNFMMTNLVNIDINKQGYVTDREGEKFIEQIISYMKYAGTMKAANDLIDKLKGYSKNSEADMPDNGGVTNIVDKKSNELQQLVKDINDRITDLKNTEELKEKINAASQKLEILKRDTLLEKRDKKHNQKVKKFLRKYRELTTLLDMKAGNVNSAIVQIKQYERKKEQFFKENGYTSDAGDYIDENRKSLENVKNTIKESKELAISDFSEIDSKNIEIVIKDIEKINTIENKLKSLYVNRVTENDKENKSIYDHASEFLKKGILSLVVDDATDISDQAVSLSNLPTTFKKEKLKESILEDTKNKAILTLYANMKFGNYLHPEKETGLKYEMEYILNGQSSDKDNLIKTIEKIAGVRMINNLAYIVTDKGKMSEISMVASSASTAIGLPFLQPVIKGVLLEAWSLAEAVSDVKVLFQGEKIPLLKNKNNWNTDLSNLVKSNTRHYKGKKGMDYECYLQIMMLLEDNHDCVYRIMDLIQINVQKRYNKDFLMSKCFQNLDFTVSFKTEPLFVAMPWVIRALSENDGGYEYKIRCNYGY